MAICKNLYLDYTAALTLLVCIYVANLIGTNYCNAHAPKARPSVIVARRTPRQRRAPADRNNNNLPLPTPHTFPFQDQGLGQENEYF